MPTCNLSAELDKERKVGHGLVVATVYLLHRCDHPSLQNGEPILEALLCSVENLHATVAGPQLQAYDPRSYSTSSRDNNHLAMIREEEGSSCRPYEQTARLNYLPGGDGEVLLESTTTQHQTWTAATMPGLPPINRSAQLPPLVMTSSSSKKWLGTAPCWLKRIAMKPTPPSLLRG